MADTPTPSDPVAAVWEALADIKKQNWAITSTDRHWRREVRDAENCGIVWCGVCVDSEAHAIARYVAACNPVAMTAILAQLEAAQKDQARYRWLRSTWCFSILERLFGIETSRTPNAQLDDAIDASIAADAALAEQQEGAKP